MRLTTRGRHRGEPRRVIVGYNGGLLGSVNLNGFIVILPELDKK